MRRMDWRGTLQGTSDLMFSNYNVGHIHIICKVYVYIGLMHLCMMQGELSIRQSGRGNACQHTMCPEGLLGMIGRIWFGYMCFSLTHVCLYEIILFNTVHNKICMF